MALRRALRTQVARVALITLATSLAVGCGTAPSPAASATLQMVAAENFWASIAQQLGGGRVHVASIITSPNTDPHSYEPTAGDARAIATAQIVLINGVGYDSWASRLLDANPTPGRVVLDVGSIVGLAPGANPHRWYSPADVRRVVDAITSRFERLDPSHSRIYSLARDRFLTSALAPYNDLIASIRRRFAGVAVGASESIFALQAPVLGLRLVTPTGFLRAISEGSEPTAQDIETAHRQITQRQIAVFIENRQNTTPDIQRQADEARRLGIPIVTITETLDPATASFQDWQLRQLRVLQSALAAATGR
jgi:zinc/manganese transport system substrate-binding protein